MIFFITLKKNMFMLSIQRENNCVFVTSQNINTIKTTYTLYSRQFLIFTCKLVKEDDPCYSLSVLTANHQFREGLVTASQPTTSSGKDWPLQASQQPVQGRMDHFCPGPVPEKILTFYHQPAACARLIFPMISRGKDGDNISQTWEGHYIFINCTVQKGVCIRVAFLVLILFGLCRRMFLKNSRLHRSLQMLANHQQASKVSGVSKASTGFKGFWCQQTINRLHRFLEKVTNHREIATKKKNHKFLKKVAKKFLKKVTNHKEVSQISREGSIP